MSERGKSWPVVFGIGSAVILLAAAIHNSGPHVEPPWRPSLWLIKQNIQEQLIEPSAEVRYRNLRWVVDYAKHDVTLCGEINGKNHYGGYTGFQPFTAMQHDDRKAVFAQYLTAPECANAPAAE